VDYPAFCEKVDEVFVVRGLDKMPARKVHLALEEGYPTPLGLLKEVRENADRLEPHK
jgi:hypothetical protein